MPGGGTDPPEVHRCGDGVVDGDEGCDDGNRVGGDGCGGNCTVEDTGAGPPDDVAECEQVSEHVDCDDTNACTIDFCAAGTCSHAPAGGPRGALCDARAVVGSAVCADVLPPSLLERLGTALAVFESVALGGVGDAREARFTLRRLRALRARLVTLRQRMRAPCIDQLRPPLRRVIRSLDRSIGLGLQG